ncbi:MAG: M13 family metallopeptidase [Treponema sp.]|nr:M13 family metallopeptidase [Treponema sp.]
MSLKKQLLTATATLLIMGIGLTGCNRGTNTDTSGGKPWIDSNIQANVKSTKKPSAQEDFHRYVNQDWLTKAKIFEGEPRFGSFREAAKSIDKKVLALLKDNNDLGHDAELVRSLYNAILDWKTRNKNGITPIIPILQDIRNIKTIDELSDFICDNERSFWSPTFVGVGNGSEFDDSSSYATFINTAGYTLGDAAEYEKRTEMGERRAKAIALLQDTLLARFGYSKEESKELFDKTLSFEGKLAAKAMTQADMMSPDRFKKINNSFTPEAVSKLAVRFPLVRYIKARGYSDAKKYIVLQPEVIKVLDSLYTEENLEEMKAYILTRTVRGTAALLDKEAEKAITEAENILSGSKGKQPDEKQAADTVREKLSTPIIRAYLAQYDLSQMKKEITEICKKVIATYREMLKKETWLSEKTRTKAIEKLDNITIHSIYPEKWVDYSELNLKGLSYFDCMKAISEFSDKLDRSHTNGKVDKELWTDMDLLEANAFYNPANNSINIIPGLLTSPFYSDGMSQEVLLGTIGSVIGHEISHAFDTNGAQFDKDGNFANWWTEEDYKAFQVRAEKLIAFYDDITVWSGVNVKGKQIQTEAIADIAGIKVMLEIAKSIPDFNYKTFFESYALLWRNINTIEFEQYKMKADPHPLNYLRTNVTLQQYDEFIEAYGIKEGDGMYLAPEKRILVW